MADLRDKYYMDKYDNFLNPSEFERAKANGDLEEAGGKFWYGNIAFDSYGNKC